MSRIVVQVVGDDGQPLAEGEWCIGHVGYEPRMVHTFMTVIKPVIDGLHETIARDVHDELGIDDHHEATG